MTDNKEELQKTEKESKEKEEPSSVVPAEIVEKIKENPETAKMFEQFSTAAIGMFKSGPDPETAKVLADAEVENQKTRLEGFKAHLEIQDKDSARDQEYRMDQLKRTHSLRRGVLLAAFLAACIGLYLYVTGNTTIGGNILFASVIIVFSILGGNFPSLGGNG